MGARESTQRGVDEQLRAGREAMAAVEEYDQEAVDGLARAVAWAVCEPDRLEEIADQCATETGVGSRSGTKAKVGELMRGSLAEIVGEPSVGQIPTDRPGVIEVAKPVGAIGALIPSTNPASTAAFLAMQAVKGRNAIILSPPPTAAKTTELVVSMVRAELDQIGAPADLVQMLDTPITRDRAHRLLELADFAHVTGSEANVEAGETTGTPNLCVGAGNATVVVDETADIQAAADRIIEGAAFDQGSVCTSESNVVVDERSSEALHRSLSEQGAYLCSAEESAAVTDVLFEDGARSRAHLARPAAEIAADAGLDLERAPELLVLSGDTDRAGPADPARAHEKLAPVVTLYEARGFKTLLEVVDGLLETDGAGHSCILHTERSDRAEQLADRIDVCRAVVNQAGALSLAGGGNGLDTTLCLGGGPWGGNQLDENLTYRHFLTTTRVARPVEGDRPADRELFEAHPNYESVEDQQPVRSDGGSTDSSGLLDRLTSLVGGR